MLLELKRLAETKKFAEIKKQASNADKKKPKIKKQFIDNKILAETLAFSKKIHVITSMPGYSKEDAEKSLSERIAITQSLKIK